MEKIKIYKSSKEVEFQTFNDYNSSKSNLSEHIYVYLYIKSNDYKNQRDGYGGGYDKDYINSALFRFGSKQHYMERDEEKMKEFIEKISIDNQGINYFSIAKGFIKGDFYKSFLIDFDNRNGMNLSILKHENKEYRGMDSIGMVGEYIDEKTFKAKFYNCFGDIIFNEDTFNLIHEGFPSNSSKDI